MTKHPQSRAIRHTLRLRLAASLSGSLLLSVLLLTQAAAQPSATALSLSADTVSAPAHTLVHLTAALAAGSATGSVTFLDNAQPLITIPLQNSASSQPLAILGIASLSAGTHTLTAQYSGDAAHLASSSAPVTLTITPPPASLAATAADTTPYVNTPVALTSTLLPSFATGTITITDQDSSATLASTPVSGSPVAGYQSFGDLITSGADIPATIHPYPELLASSFGLTLENLAGNQSTACDILPWQILANSLGPTQSSAPLASVMAGSMDAHTHPYSPVFDTCQQATLAWLAIPREYKLLPGDPAITLTGPWASPGRAFDTLTYGTLLNSSGQGSARITITSAGQPVYLWYLLADELPGSFTLSVDGVSTGVAYSTQPVPALASPEHPSSIAYALLRLPVPAGLHVLDISVQSGAVGILAAATPPSPGIASIHPVVLVTDVPNQNSADSSASPSAIAQYSRAVESTVSLLQADGLDVRLVPTHTFFTGDPSEYLDAIHPDSLGYTHLASAFQSTLAAIPVTSFSSFQSQPTISTVTLSTPGVHNLISTYSGDNLYVGTVATPLTLTVLPQNDSTITLSTPHTRYTSGTSIPFFAVVTPSTATGSITFYDATSFLAQSPLASGTATFSTSALAPGDHSLTAVYSGDSPDTSSASPTLVIQVDRDSPTLTLSPIPSSLAAEAQVNLTATILPPDATGPITFTDSYLAPDSTVPRILTIGTATLNAGGATLAAAGLAPGTHTFTAAYAGDSSHLAATSSPRTSEVSLSPTTTSLASTLSALTFGSPETLTATVSPASATGSVTFHDSLSGSVTTVPISGGVAVYATAELKPGTHLFTATYSGDPTDSTSTSPIASITVNPVPAILVLAPVPPSISAEMPLTLTATVTPADSTGTVIFRDIVNGSLGQATLTGGVATLRLPGLDAGHYLFTAVYSGDTTHATATSASISTEIAAAATTLTLASTPGSTPFGAPLALAASIAPASATGVVSVWDSSTLLGSTLLTGGSATFTLTSLPPGLHTLSLSYPGDTANAPATSAARSITITPAVTATTLAVAQLDVPAGTPATFDIRVTSATTTPTGMVTIHSGATLLSAGPLSNLAAGVGYATLSVPTLSLGLGSFPVVASYLGSPVAATSDSPVASFSVVPIPTTTTLTLSQPLAPLQTPITLSATVSSTSQIPSGSVTFRVNGNPVATLALDASGSASTTFAPTLTGTFAVSASYDPAGFFASSAAPPQPLRVTLPLAISLAPASLNIAASSTQSVALTITPLSGFTGPISTSCRPSDAFITCAITSPSAITGPAPVNALLTVTVGPGNRASAAPAHTAATLSVAFCVLLLPLIRVRRAQRMLVRVLLLTAASISVAGCAEGGNFGAIPPGAYSVEITVKAAGAAIPATLAITIPQ